MTEKSLVTSFQSLSQQNQSFRAELQTLLNKFNREGVSDTPDYILQKYMISCLRAFDSAVIERDKFYEFNPREEAVVSAGEPDAGT